MSRVEACALLEEESFDVSAGVRLRVRTVKPRSGTGFGAAPTLVFLHEGLGSIGQWREFPRELVRETGFPAVIYDRPGFGASGPLHRPHDGRYLQREDTGCLISVLESLGIEAPILIGHSDGGTIALLYAAQFPLRPLGVIVEAAHVFSEKLTLTGIRAAVKAFERGGLRDGLSRHHGDNTDPMFRRWADEWLAPELAAWNVERHLGAVRAPVLAIQGEADQYGTLSQVASILGKVSGPAQSCIIPGCGHAPHHEAKDAVLRAMSRFIAEATAAVSPS